MYLLLCIGCKSIGYVYIGDYVCVGVRAVVVYDVSDYAVIVANPA